MPQENEALARWKASVPPGVCPACKKPLPPPRPGRGNKRQAVHTRKRCRQKYMAVRQQGVRPPLTLRTVRRISAVPGKSGRVLLTFKECGHQQETYRSKVELRKRRKCHVCVSMAEAGKALLVTA